MKVFVISPDKAENHGAIEDALRASGHELVNAVCSPVGVTDKLNAQQPKPDVLLVRADVVQRDREDEMLSLLAAWPVVVLVPPGRSGRKAALEAMRQSAAPHVRGVLSAPPFDFSGLNELCAVPVAEPVATRTVPVVTSGRPPSSVPALTPAAASCTPTNSSPLRRQLRLGFYGSRGGVGVSTAALKVAQAIAARGQRVALCDATGRGDLHVMLGREPGHVSLATGEGVAHQVQLGVMVIGALSVFMGLPTEEAARGFEAVIVDGGRQAGSFNAQWIRIEKPLSDQAIARWAGMNESSAPRSVGIGRLVSIEVTD